MVRISSLRYNLTCLRLVVVLAVTAMPAMAQQTLSDRPIGLEEAIGIALKNNPQLKQSDLQVQANDIAHQQSRWQRWPSLSFSASQGFSFGRNIDPFTNEFVQQNISFNNYQLGANVTLFNGFQLQNTVKQNEQITLASQKEYDAARNSVMLNVALSYLQVLNNQELVIVAERQLDATNEQVTRMDRLVTAGVEPVTKLLDLKAQMANDELNLLNAQNNVELSKLSLKQHMNIPGNTQLEIAAIALPDPQIQLYDATVNEVYEAAIASLPQMEAAKLRIQAAETGIAIARGRYLPSLTLSGGISTAYSSNAPKERFISTGQPGSQMEVPSTTDFLLIDGKREFLTRIVSVPGGEYQHFNYFNVLDFNRSSSLNLSLRIPIFNNFQAKYSVASAKVQRLNATYQDEIAANTIRQDVEQAYISMANAAKRYTATQNQVQAFDEAFRAAQSRFTAGALSTAEFNIAKANLDRGQANLVQAKYDYYFRTKVLDFYMGRPLDTN